MAAIRKVEDLSTDPKFIGYYDIEEAHEQDIEDAIATGTRQGIEQGISQGISQGIEQGTRQRNIEIAKNMIKDNESIEKISRYTGLTQNELNKLV